MGTVIIFSAKETTAITFVGYFNKDNSLRIKEHVLGMKYFAWKSVDCCRESTSVRKCTGSLVHQTYQFFYKKKLPTGTVENFRKHQVVLYAGRQFLAVEMETIEGCQTLLKL